tara:strand:+ start:6073 stop:6717 length:645 start_codon:yes stop_codon:yes gene_type:complete
MRLFPTLVVDDFLEDPDYVLCLATNAEYNNPGHTNYPGVTSKKKIHELDQELFDIIIQKIFGYYWDLRNPVNYNVEMEFQKIEKNGQGIIHLDTTYGALAAGVIYLNQDIERDTGTSFYKLLDPDYKIKEEFLDPVARYHAGEILHGHELDIICEKHYNKFEETMRVQNQYNRLVTYDSNVWHTATSYGNQTRYTLRFFINELESKHQDFPLQR